MSAQTEQGQNRREFLRGSARYLALGGLVLVTGVLFSRKKTSAIEEKCINLGVCRSCSVFKNCGLQPCPQDENNRDLLSSSALSSIGGIVKWKRNAC